MSPMPMARASCNLGSVPCNLGSVPYMFLFPLPSRTCLRHASLRLLDLRSASDARVTNSAYADQYACFAGFTNGEWG